MKHSTRALSLILTIAIFIGILPIGHFARSATDAVPYGLAEQFDAQWHSELTGPASSTSDGGGLCSELEPQPFEFEIPQAQPITADFEIPPTFIYDEAFEEYIYIPRAERMAMLGMPKAAGDGQSGDGSLDISTQPDYPSSNLNEYNVQMHMYRSFMHADLLGSETDLLLQGLLLEGHGMQEALAAYGMSRVLDIDARALIDDGQNAEASLPDVLTETGRRNFILLAGDYNVRADALAEFAIGNGLDFQCIELLAMASIALYNLTLNTLGRSGEELVISEGYGKNNYKIYPH
jgi:hypothetical protein